MPGISRRVAIGTLAAGAIGATTTLGASQSESDRMFSNPAPRSPAANPIDAENRRRGSKRWKVGVGGTRAADDVRMQIKGYASAASVNLGEAIDFHVTVTPAQAFNIEIYRLGHYATAGARHIVTSPTIDGVEHPRPEPDAVTGLISCDWPSAWRVTPDSSWTSGYYLAVFTTTSGWRSYAPFVVRDDARVASLCVIIPFTTYQAYNQWPTDGVRGKSLYYGYKKNSSGSAPAGQDPAAKGLDSTIRARKVSFDRPYGRNGLPDRYQIDYDFLQWAESRSYDLTYATSIDLHNGTVDLTRYSGVVFSGHDEYWSREMRDAATKAVGQGTSLAFLGANNVYWHIRFEPSADGRADRAVVCYKNAADPHPGENGATTQWRDGAGPAQPEQALLGVQYNGILPANVPLVVSEAHHWFWAGTGLANGDRIDKMVGGEADGLFPDLPLPSGVIQTILSASPYRTREGVELVQNSSVYETERGAVVFTAGSLTWTYGLIHKGFVDERIRRATANLLNRMQQKR